MGVCMYIGIAVVNQAMQITCAVSNVTPLLYTSLCHIKFDPVVCTPANVHKINISFKANRNKDCVYTKAIQLIC